MATMATIKTFRYIFAWMVAGMAYRVTQCSRLRRDRFRFSFFSSSLRSEVELEAQPTVKPEACAYLCHGFDLILPLQIIAFEIFDS